MRAARVRALGEEGIADLDGDLAERHAERAGGELGEDRGRAGAQVLRAAANDHAALRVDRDLGVRGHPVHWIAGRSHAPAEAVRAVAKAADLARAPVPAEGVGGHAITRAELVARPGKSGVLVVRGVVGQAQREGIDPEVVRQLVERRLEREAARALTGRAHRVGLRSVDAHEPVRGRDVRTRVEHARYGRGRISVLAEHRGRGERVVGDRGQLAALGRGDAEILDRFLPASDQREHLAAGELERDRPADVTRRPHAEHQAGEP